MSVSGSEKREIWNLQLEMPRSDDDSVLSTHLKSDGELYNSSDNQHKRSRHKSWQKHDRTLSSRHQDLSPTRSNSRRRPLIAHDHFLGTERFQDPDSQEKNPILALV